MKGPHLQRRSSTGQPATAERAGARRGFRRLTAVATIAALLVVTACRSRPAQRNAPTLRLTDTRGYLELVAERREREQRSKVAARRTRSQETVFEESVEIELDGFVYHPNLLEFTFAGLFGLLQHTYQEDYTGGQRSGSESGPVLEFDFTGNVLQKKSYPGMFYARRAQALVPRAFRSSVETTSENYGLLWQYLSEKTPTRLLFDYRDIRLDPLATDEEDGRQQNTTFRFETGYNFSEYNVLSFVYEHEEVSEEPFALNYDSDELLFAHRLAFGREHQHRLDSDLTFYDQRGTQDIERIRWRENLQLQHSDTLRSRYQFEAFDRTHGSLSGLPPIQERSYRLFSMLEHKLYESLVSEMHGFLQTQEFESGAEVDRQGLAVGLNYRKTNRWGALRANYRAGLEWEDRRGAGFRAEVIDEQHSFRDPEPITLSNPNIETGSITITALDRITFYQLGQDYTLRTIGDRVEIERIATGRITDGESVLIDYVFSLGGNFALDSFSQNFSVRQDFEFGLSPYYRLRWQDQNISPRSATGALPEDITAHILGVEYRLRTLRLSAEFEEHDSTINPFQAIRLSGAYSHKFKNGVTAGLHANWSDISYDRPYGRQTTFFTLQGRYRHPLTRTLSFEGAATYRTMDDTLTGKDEGVDLDLSLEWFIRQTEIKITYELSQFEDVYAKNDSSMLYFRLRRRF